jgi:hypothetical protein
MVRVHEPQASATRFNLDDIVTRIETGQSFVQIAQELGTARSHLYAMMARWSAQDSSARDRLDAAKQLSAEAWLDKGMDTLEQALRRDSGIDSTAARAYAQECARRAAIRNPQYRDKVDVSVQRKAGDYSGMSDDELIALAKAQQPSIGLDP